MGMACRARLLVVAVCNVVRVYRIGCFAVRPERGGSRGTGLMVEIGDNQACTRGHEARSDGAAGAVHGRREPTR